MKKLLLILPLLVFFACSNTTTDESKSNKGLTNESKSDKATTKIDTIWNDTVQDTFFGTKFGASLEEVNKNFKMFYDMYSDTVSIRVVPFGGRKSRGFLYGETLSDRMFYDLNFAGFNWTIVLANFYHNKFCGIKFYSNEDIGYEQIEKLISRKYKLTEIEPEDSIIISKKIAFGKNGCELVLSHYNRDIKDKSHESYYNVVLEYRYVGRCKCNSCNKTDEEILEEI